MRSRYIGCFFMLLLLLAIFLEIDSVIADDIYISPIGGGSGTINDPVDFQTALNLAADNGDSDDILYLQTGTYNGNFVYNPVADNGNIEIQGGWNDDYSMRNIDPANTVLDGSNAGNVMKFKDFASSTVSGSIKVEGVTIRNGRSSLGAGIYAFTIPPGTIEIRNNIIENNEAQGLGGGCTLACGDWGGNVGGTIVLADNIIRNNKATGFMDAGTAETGEGGGCSVFATGETILVNNLIHNNSSGTSDTFEGLGGGILVELYGGTTHLVNNTITNNRVFKAQGTTSGTGGGIVLSTADTAWGPSNTFVYNTIIYGNFSESLQGSKDIANTILDSGISIGSTLDIHFSDYGDMGIAGVIPTLSNNIHVFPHFSKISESLYYLTGRSACVDAGFNSAPNIPAKDLAGLDRPQDGNSDGQSVANIGCYEQVVNTRRAWSPGGISGR